MQVYQNETSGLYWVELGGVIWNNCTADVNCPGRARCVLNASWSQYPAMCTCSFFLDFNGANCEEVTLNGWFFYYGYIVAAVIACFWLAVAIFDLFRMIRWKRFHRDALSTSLIFVILGLLFTALQVSASTQFIVQTLPPDATGSRSYIPVIVTVSEALAYLFSTLAMLNVSVVWIEIAENADKMRKNQTNNITRYKKALAVYYFFFFGILAVTLGLGNTLVAAAFAVPGVVFIIISYIVAAFKMRKMLGSYISSSDVQDGSIAAAVSSRNTLQKMRESLRAVEYAAFGVSFCTLLFIVWMGLWVLLGGFAEAPGKKFNIIAMTLAWIFVASGNGTVMWYLHGAIRRKGKAIASNAEKGVIVAVGQAQSEMPSPRLTTPLSKRKNKEGQNSGSIPTPKQLDQLESGAPSTPIPQAEEDPAG